MQPRNDNRRENNNDTRRGDDNRRGGDDNRRDQPRRQPAQHDAGSAPPENEIRVTTRGTAGRYISRAGTLFLKQNLDTILLKAAGNAISTLCVASEVIRRRIPGLHQVNHLTSVDITDEYDNREEGPTKVNRKLTLLEIKLTKKPEQSDLTHSGYQAPLPKDQVEELTLEELTSGGPGRNNENGDRPPRRQFNQEEGDDQERPQFNRQYQGGRGFQRGFRRGGNRGGRYQGGGNRPFDNRREYDNQREGGENRRPYNREGDSERPQYQKREGGDERPRQPYGERRGQGGENRGAARPYQQRREEGDYDRNYDNRRQGEGQQQRRGNASFRGERRPGPPRGTGRGGKREEDY